MKKITGGMNVGTSSVLSAFVILCLVTFAALSFLSANTDHNLSKQAAAKTKEYYKACTDADIVLVQIYNELNETAAESTDREEYYKAVSSKYKNNSSKSFYTLTEDEGMTKLGFTLPINEQQNLQILLDINYPDSGDYSVFHIDSYKTVMNPEWHDDSEAEGSGLMKFD
ncbi:MAG: hypothetical protein K6B28_01580 [Lachnospiraceae bacterium]|nr:hypothetical protein [Lachnospiraceae bacterium]